MKPSTFKEFYDSPKQWDSYLSNDVISELLFSRVWVDLDHLDLSEIKMATHKSHVHLEKLEYFNALYRTWTNLKSIWIRESPVAIMYEVFDDDDQRECHVYTTDKEAFKELKEYVQELLNAEEPPPDELDQETFKEWVDRFDWNSSETRSSSKTNH